MYWWQRGWRGEVPAAAAWFPASDGTWRRRRANKRIAVTDGGGGRLIQQPPPLQCYSSFAEVFSLLAGQTRYKPCSFSCTNDGIQSCMLQHPWLQEYWHYTEWPKKVRTRILLSTEQLILWLCARWHLKCTYITYFPHIRIVAVRWQDCRTSEEIRRTLRWVEGDTMHTRNRHSTAV